MKNRLRKFLTHVRFLERKTFLMSVAALAMFVAALALAEEVPPSVRDQFIFSSQLHTDRGLEQMEKKNFHYAKAEFQFVINMEYDVGYKSVAYLNLGVISFMEDNPDRAIKYYQSALQIKPDYAEAYFNMGGAYYKQEDLKKAEEAFLKAIELQPSYGRAHYSLGALYFDQKKYDLAWKHAEKAEEYGIPYKSLKEKLAKVKSRS